MKPLKPLKASAVSSIFLALFLILTAAGCRQAPDEGTASPAVSPAAATPAVPTDSAGPESTPSVDELPAVIEIPITREGETEVFTASLNVSGKGYGVYLLPGYVFVPDDEFDAIQPGADSVISSGINVRIYKTDPDSAIPEPTETGADYAIYERVTLKTGTFDVQFNYPAEAAEGGGVMLRAMIGTMAAVR